jgi:hypothetical protein
MRKTSIRVINMHMQLTRDIEKYPEDHMASHLDGFELHDSGVGVLALKRRDENGNEITSGRTGKCISFSTYAIYLDPLCTRRCRMLQYAC